MDATVLSFVLILVGWEQVGTYSSHRAVVLVLFGVGWSDFS